MNIYTVWRLAPPISRDAITTKLQLSHYLYSACTTRVSVCPNDGSMLALFALFDQSNHHSPKQRQESPTQRQTV